MEIKLITLGHALSPLDDDGPRKGRVEHDGRRRETEQQKTN